MIATLLLLAAAPVQATAPAPPPAMVAPSATALHIASRLASLEIVTAQTRRLLREQFPAAMRDNPEMRALEQRLPGVTAEMAAAMEPIIVASLARRLPAYQREVAAIYQRRMTPAELTAVAAFYDSPTGVHLTALIRDGVDYTRLLGEQLRAGGEAAVSRDDLSATIMPAVQPALAGLSDAEQLTLMRFGMTAAGRKLQGINRELLDVAVRFNNERDEATEREVDAAMTALIDRRLPATKR